EVEDHLEDLRVEADQLRGLRDAYLQGEEAVRQANIAIEAQNDLRKLGIDLQSAEGQELLELHQRVGDYRNAIEDITEREQRHKRTVAEIRGELDRVDDSYETAVAAANRWRTEALAGLDPTKEGYEQFADQVETIYRDRLTEAMEDHLDASRRWQDGATRALRDYSDAATDAASNTERALTTTMRGLEDVLVSARSAADAAEAIAEDIARIFIRQQITGPLAGFLGGVFSDAFGGGTAPLPGESDLQNPALRLADVKHGGGIAGLEGRRRPMPASTWIGAPRFHNGYLAPNEVPAILEKGESVLTPGQMRTLGSMGTPQVTIINNSSQPIAGEASVGRGSDGRPEIRVLVEDLVDDSLRTGRLRRTVQSEFDVSPRVTRRA
ncbi:MAG: phage tail tape measure C-terminal domain-containing protein, partial [Acetobacterales bacterium]